MSNKDDQSSPDARSWISVRTWSAIVVFCLLTTTAVLCDQAVSTWAEMLPTPGRELASAITVLGDAGYMFAGSAIVAAMAWWACGSTRDRQVRADLARLMERALLFFVVIAVSGLAAQALKHLVGRSRPMVGGPNAFSFHPLFLSNAFASFPSGHATSAFAAVTALRSDDLSRSTAAAVAGDGDRRVPGGLA